MARVGYIRVSTVEQNAARQLDDTDVEKTFIDKASGRDAERPELQAMLEFVRAGDTLLVHSMDRLARNLDDLRGLVQRLTARGVRIEFVHEQRLSGEGGIAGRLLSV